MERQPLRTSFGRARSFLTTLGGDSARPDPGSLTWFPLVGVVIGVGVAGVLAAGFEWSSVLVAAVLAVAADFAITGLLHWDGLADSADGLLPPVDRDRRLAIMSDPRVGGFAVAVVPLMIGARVAGFAGLYGLAGPFSQDPVNLAALLGAVFCASRAGTVLVMLRVPYARSSGLVSTFTGSDSSLAENVGTTGPTQGTAVAEHRLAFTVSLLTIALSIALISTFGLRAAVAAILGILAGGGLVVLANRRLGGYTGDVLGALIVIVETTVVLGIAR